MLSYQFTWWASKTDHSKKNTQLCNIWPKLHKNIFTGKNVGVKLFNIPQTRLENSGYNTLGIQSSASGCRVRASIFPVVAVGLLEHVLAGDFSFEFGADEEGAAHLAVEGVRLLGRRRESLPQHHGDQAVDALGGALSSEVKGLLRGEGLPEDHHCVHVGVLHHLITGHSS